MTLFKRNPLVLGHPPEIREDSVWSRRQRYFNAYANGKAAVRVRPDIIALGCHCFGSSSADLAASTVALANLAILHYVNCGFENYFSQYHVSGAFPDTWYGDHRIEIPFHLQSRDAYLAGRETLRRLNRDELMLNPSDVDREMASGCRTRCVIPAKMRKACDV